MKKWQRIGVQFFDGDDNPVGDMEFAVISDDRRALTETYATLSELDAAVEKSNNHPILIQMRERNKQIMQ